MTARDRYTRLGVLAAVLIFAADQASKAWILYGIELPLQGRIDLLPVLSLTMVWNRGVTFGLLTGTGWASEAVLAAIALAVVAALAVWLRRAESRLTAIALGSVAGGAIGNVLDRLRFGAVVDFIHVHVGTWSWYVFNVADAAIVCGVAALVLDGLRGPGKDRRKDGRLAGA
ncbi:MAG TPA: signal peptidase II [Acidisphaera sp.]|nr:signal peptidase II [Acidisphaera sp.]